MSLTLESGSRNEPKRFVCSHCGKPVQFTLHHDFMEAHCCATEYQVKVDDGVWNCCSTGINVKESE